ncbi:unnamed protein product, partial [Musa acuminata subsp. burmannicoides]
GWAAKVGDDVPEIRIVGGGVGREVLLGGPESDEEGGSRRGVQRAEALEKHGIIDQKDDGAQRQHRWPARLPRKLRLAGHRPAIASLHLLRVPRDEQVGPAAEAEKALSPEAARWIFLPSFMLSCNLVKIDVSRFALLDAACWYTVSIDGVPR